MHFIISNTKFTHVYLIGYKDFNILMKISQIVTKMDFSYA